MFHRAIRGHSPPKYLSSDHDPLYRFHQWEANLRHPRGHRNQECSLRAAFASLRGATYRHDSPRVEAKLIDFQHYYNGHRTHAGAGRGPAGTACGRNGITKWSRFVPVAEALSRLVPNSDSRLILFNSPCTGFGHQIVIHLVSLRPYNRQLLSLGQVLCVLRTRHEKAGLKILGHKRQKFLSFSRFCSWHIPAWPRFRPLKWPG